MPIAGYDDLAELEADLRAAEARWSPPAPAIDRLTLRCPACGRSGSLGDAGGCLDVSAGFAFAALNTPICASCGEEVGLVLPPAPSGAYEVGADCPRDDLQLRLEAARALQLLNPCGLGPVRRWSI